MNRIGMFAASAAMALATIPFASPAMAQGTKSPAAHDGARCPSGWRNHAAGENGKLCYPRSSSSPAIYLNRRGRAPCASGYGQAEDWCVAGVKSSAASSRDSGGSSSSGGSGGPVYIPPTFGSVKKASAYDRCPVGYHTSQPDVMECVSYDYAAGKQPATRAKNGKPCAANEVDEWGLWCTSKVTRLTRKEAEQEAVADVNHIFPRDGKGGNQGADYMNTPGIVAIFGPAGTPATSAASTGSAGDQPGSGTAQCANTNGAATGAVIGGALGGQAGAALGGMLGGLGKRKNRGGC